jgi:cytochrome c553
VHAQSISAGERKHGFCATCHGINGRSFKVNYPILAGQTAPYILSQLFDFKEGRRSDPTMDAIVPQLSDGDMRDLAAFFAALEPYSSPSESDPIKAIRGKKMAESAQCVSCHIGGPDSAGGELPRIQGQHRNYIVKQLKDFRAGRRTNDGGLMHDITQSMTDADTEDLGNYFAATRFDGRQRKRE